MRKIVRFVMGQENFCGGILKKERNSMKLIKKLKAYNQEDAKKAIFGFGIIRAMDYEKERYGHLILISLNIKVCSFLKKLFIYF